MRVPKVPRFALSNHQKLHMEHLDQLQRYPISAYLKAGKSYGYIAKALEVNKNILFQLGIVVMF